MSSTTTVEDLIETLKITGFLEKFLKGEASLKIYPKEVYWDNDYELWMIKTTYLGGRSSENGVISLSSALHSLITGE